MHKTLRTLLQYINILSAIVLVLLIPFNVKGITKFVIGFLLGSWLLSARLSYLWNQLVRNWKWILPLVLFYVMHMISYLYSSDTDFALFDLLKKLSLILVPLTFFTYHNLSQKHKTLLLQLFMLGTLLSVLIGIGNVVHVVQTDEYFRRLFPRYPLLVTYQNFSIFAHSAYLGMFLVFSIASIVYLVFEKSVLRKGRVFWILLAVFFAAAVVVNASRSGILSLSVLILFTVFYYLKGKIRLVAIGLIISGVAVVFATNLRFQKYSNMMELFQSPDEIMENSQELIESHVTRPIIWVASVEVIRENFWFGVGNGDLKKAMKEKYEQYGVNDQFRGYFNPHNQFLSTFVMLGFTGFLILLAVFIVPALQALRKKQYLVLSFLLIVFVHALTESIFGRLQGVIFFSFFYGLVMTFLPAADIAQSPPQQLKSNTVT